MAVYEELANALNGQSHVLKWFDSISDAGKESLAQQINNINVELMDKAFKGSITTNTYKMEDISPLPSDRCIDKESISEIELDKYYNIGLEAISKGEVAALVLAGGQASRLGADKPKGTLKLGIGLSETDSLFYIQAARLCHLIELAKEAFPKSNPSICWLVMVSKTTFKDTQVHLEKVLKETGFKKEDLHIFAQNEIPSFDFEGKFLLKSKAEIATNPDGNGGIYNAIRPMLPMLEEKGLRYFHVFSVDNILCKVADPHFIGASIAHKADCSAKIVEKKEPNEAVGNICLENGRVRVVEYSEITKEMAERRDATNPEKLYLRAGSIANHIFRIDFLKDICNDASKLPYHVARKKIPYVDLVSGELVRPTEPNGIKLELFIFDSFPYSKNFLAWQVAPSEEFSPLKNPNSAGVDCMDTCLRDFTRVFAKTGWR